MYNIVISRIVAGPSVVNLKEKVVVHCLCDSTAESNYLHSIASEWIIAEVGKNNFVDSLGLDKPIKECQVGYIMRYDADKTKLELWYNTEVEYGWVRSCKEIKSEYCGYFEILPIVDTKILDGKFLAMQREIDLLREDAKYAVRSHQTPVKCLQRTDLHDETVSLIKNFDMSKLRKVDTTTNNLIKWEDSPIQEITAAMSEYYTKQCYSDRESDDSDDEFSDCTYHDGANMMDIIDDNVDVETNDMCNNNTTNGIDDDSIDDDDASKLETFSDETRMHIYELTRNNDKYRADRCTAELDRRMNDVFNKKEN